jgi:hypothetical protein
MGLAERRDVRLAWGRERPAVFWRASAEGRAARVLEWREPGEGDDDAEGG